MENVLLGIIERVLYECRCCHARYVSRKDAEWHFEYEHNTPRSAEEWNEFRK